MPTVKRKYDASNRRTQASARRHAVVLAAKELIDRDGFRATTIAAVAERAGISAESIYKGLGTKAALAKALFDFVIAGDDAAVPVAERAEADAVRSEPDLARKIMLYTRGLAKRQHRSATVRILIRDGRHTDETLANIWEQLLKERLNGMTMLGRHLVESGQLPEASSSLRCVIPPEVRAAIERGLQVGSTRACPSSHPVPSVQTRALPESVAGAAKLCLSTDAIANPRHLRWTATWLRRTRQTHAAAASKDAAPGVIGAVAQFCRSMAPLAL